MSLGVSLFLFAVGAVLAFAVNYQLAEVDIAAVGWILMAVGVVGIFLYFLFLASFAPFYRGSDLGGTHVAAGGANTHTTVIDRQPTTHTTEVVERPVERTVERTTTHHVN